MSAEPHDDAAVTIRGRDVCRRRTTGRDPAARQRVR